MWTNSNLIKKSAEALHQMVVGSNRLVNHDFNRISWGDHSIGYEIPVVGMIQNLRPLSGVVES